TLPALLAGLVSTNCADKAPFRLTGEREATIRDIHAAMESGGLTCRELVQMYLNRIEKYDKQGPYLNSIITLNPEAPAIADSLDKQFIEAGFVGPLHGIPVIVKDNYDTADLPTTAGSRSLKGSRPPDDAYQVRKLREAGAIILAKSNMAEFAWSPYETVGSKLPGHTRNPYDPTRVPAGSSGGTAAAVAANFGTVGLGTDTGNSIRGPSSHTMLVGIRSTMGLTSRDGIVPLNVDRDIGGPMARTVADAVAVFDLIAGYDPADPVTASSRDKRPKSYLDYLDKDGLRGARIGVLRKLFTTDTADPEIIKLMERAIEDMRKQGAEIIDPLEIPDLDNLIGASLWCDRFRTNINNYLASLGPEAPVKNLEEIIASGDIHPSIKNIMVESQEEPPEKEIEQYRITEANAARLREAVLSAMDNAGVDALIYPTWNNPPRLIGDLNSPHGNNSPLIAPHTGFPAITVPMGWFGNKLPAGLQLLGRAWSEPTLIKLAYAYEQATGHRRPPASTPPLP
ncbi:amidase family protein, partial [candidate division KSB1 bacterium]